jgi:hypothetical protein
MLTDIGQTRLGGPNSAAGGVNDYGEVGDGAETLFPDPTRKASAATEPVSSVCRSCGDMA